jgi:membrane protease YdiL (CAAX protease family)/ABC-type transport system involved in multi-copper enzyme maturation permease subunit
VAPLLLFPLFILIMNRVERTEERRLEEETYLYAVAGSRSAWAIDLAEAAIGLDGAAEGDTLPDARFELTETDDPAVDLAAGRIHLVIEGLSAEEWDSIRHREEEEHVEADADRETDVDPVGSLDPSAPDRSGPAVRILYRAQSDFSREARQRMRDRLNRLRSARRDSSFRAAGFPVALDEVGPVERDNIATAAKEGGALLGMALLPFLVILMLTGGSIVAADAISGEKERGTLETLLTTAAGRNDIVRSKLLAVIAVGLAVAVINLANLLVYFGIGVLELPPNFAVSVGPVDLAVLLLLLVPVTIVIGSSLLLLSGISKSYKEYQIYFFPLFLVFLVPSLAPILPGLELRSVVALVPLAGVGVAIREIMVGTLDFPFILAAFASTAAVGLWLARLTEQTLSNERLISAADLDQADLTGGPALFPRHVLRWFLGLWVAFFLTSLWFGEDLGIRGQLLVNLVGIFLGGSLLMIRRYRLDVREAFALRAPHPAAWLAVLIGAPSALVLGVGLADLVNRFVFPIPTEVLEAFGESLAAPEMGLLQLVFFFSILPGVVEELTFRGVLLHGLRKRFRPWVLCLVVGLIFGAFHVSLFRIAPTAWLGLLLSATVLLTGSIFPAMAWHALSNALALIPFHLGWLPEGFEPPAWATPLSAIALACAFAILWVTRRPYPDLRG